MIKRFLLLWFLLIPFKVLAATDPLSAHFFPSIDQNAADYTTSFGTITVTDSLYKVYQSSIAPGNVHWAIQYQMQNEIQSFQIHATPTSSVSSLTVTMGNLVNAQTGTVIYSTSTDILVHREFYLTISTPTSYSTTTYMSGTRNVNMPDILIPAVDPYYHQTTNAFPVAVSAGNTQSAWIDVHTASTVPSGYYSGSAYISSGAVVVSTIPVVVAVWAWVMPSTAALPTLGAGFGYNYFCDVAYGGVANCGNYPDSGGSADGANTIQWIDGSVQMLDNRISVAYPSNVYPQTGGGNASYVQYIGPLLNGTTAHVTGILKRAVLQKPQLEHIAFSGAEWQNWATLFVNQSWFTNRLFYYLCDEPPSGCSFQTLIANSTNTRTFSTPVVPNLVTVDMADALANGATNYIDLMTPIINNLDTPNLGNLRSTYNAWLSTNVFSVPREIGSYQDCESAGTCSNGTIGPANTYAWPNRHVDGTPVANRAFETWAYLNQINYELYFASDYCSGPGLCQYSNPWLSVYAFGDNGDGTIIYPSTATYVSVSTPIWVPSMRLKYWRDGLQDYEYENYLNSVGQGSLVSTQIATWMQNGFTFSNSPAGIEAARIAMGTAIHQLTYPASPAAPTPPSTITGQVTITGKVTVQ